LCMLDNKDFIHTEY